MCKSENANSQTTITDYDRGRLDEQDRIIEAIRNQMKAWGHNFAPDCACCITARGIMEKVRNA